MARSLKKGVYIDRKLLMKVQEMLKTGQKKVIKTWARDCTIIPQQVCFNLKN